MRWLAGAGLFALVGCNQIFGLSATQAIDAPPDAATIQHVTLDWQIGTIASGAPSQPIYMPITPAPKVRLATMTGAFTDATYGADGTITIPHDLLGAAWRLEYTLADGVVHEVQWQPADNAHITVPIFGRTTRDPVPAGAGYTVTLTNAPASFNLPRVFTTGLWTEGVGPTASGSTVDYSFSTAVSLSGAPGNPDAAGDRGLVIDYNSNANCRVATGAADFSSTLQDGKHSTVTGNWVTTSLKVVGADIPQTFGPRLNANPQLATYIQAATTLLYGVSANPSLPGLTASDPAVRQLYNAQLPVPVMATLLECPINGVPATTAPSLPAYLANAPRILHVQLIGRRIAADGGSGISLISGLETVLTPVTSGATDNFSMSFPAPLATAIALTPAGKSKVALDGATEQVDIGSATGTFTLSFTPEAGAGLHSDYYEIVLHQLSNGAMSAVRSFTVPAPANGGSEIDIAIDGGNFTVGAINVFEIRSFVGQPGAARGDFTTVTYPYSSAILFSQTFKATSP